jgi:hypothetical protein
MPHTRPALLLAASIAAVAAVGVAAPVAPAADRAAISRLERIAYNRLGPDALGCAYAKDATSPVLLKVTDKEVLPAARRIAASMRFPVTVRLIPRRYGLPGMEKVYQRLNRAAQGHERVRIVRDLEAIRSNTCGPAKILYNDFDADWAAAQQRRFGSDRVTLRLIEPGDIIPA